MNAARGQRAAFFSTETGSDRLKPQLLALVTAAAWGLGSGIVTHGRV
ncbi:MAG: hypothetical protein RBT60_12905 [Candidatus Krumholzibacteria bacterium]|nr:hypothetical protein [Candidatus Krumholzibacteria bacterium]